MTFRVRELLVAAGLFVLVGCGGGGGGSASDGGGSPPPFSSPGYVGTTTAADVSAAAVPPLSGWLLLELGLTDGLDYSSIASQSSQGIVAKPSRLAIQKRFSRARQRAVAFASKMTINAIAPEACDLGGTADVNDAGVRTDGTGVVVFTFRDCADVDGTIMNGVVRITIAAVDATLQEPSDYTVTYENLRVSAGTDSVEAGGTLRIVVTGSTIRTTRNTIARYLPDNVYLRLQDFETVSTAIGPGGTPSTNVTFRGRFYHSRYGYVDVQTPLAVLVEFSGAPIAGYMAFTGASPTARAEVRFRNEGMVVISLAITGGAERLLLASRSDLLRPIDNYVPVPQAGGTTIVREGETVTLNAFDSRDWEGAPLTYGWTVPAGPTNTLIFPPGSERTYSFTPAVPGIYEVLLTVSDGTNVSSVRVFVTVIDIPGPLANAGPDRTTVERSTVTLDASGTTHAGSPPDALEFTWSRLAAPAGSNAPMTLTGVQPQVAIDVAGRYEYRVDVSGTGGSSSDTVVITADPVVTASPGAFAVGTNSPASSTTFAMPIHVHASYTGAPLSLSISSNVDWLTIDTPNVTTATTSVMVRLDLDGLATLSNGFHQGVVRIVPTGGYTEWNGTFSLNLLLPEVRQISPYVVYTGQSTTVNLLGAQLDIANGRVVVNGNQVLGLSRASTSKARAQLPSLTPGEYTVSVTNSLGIGRPAARLVVRDPPAHPNSEVTLPGRPYSIEYDSERDVFYGVFGTDNGEYLARRFHRLANGTWQFDPITVPNPRALTIALGGQRLLVTSTDCGVYEVDPATLQTVAAQLMPGCSFSDFGLIAAFANGDVILGDASTQASPRTYPGFETYGLLPNVIAQALVSHDRSRMLWAQSNDPNLWMFDVLGGALDATPTATLIEAHDATAGFSRFNLGISGDGSHFMHRGDLYDSSNQYVGSLQGIVTANVAPGLSRRGTRAVVYNNDTDELTSFDVSTGNGFPSLGLIDTFAEEVGVESVVFFPDDTAVFMPGTFRTGSAPGSVTFESRLIVRGVP